MWLLWLALAVAQEPEPSEHTLIYYNARMALREGKPLEATKLWLLRNAWEDQTGLKSPHDDDFGSVTWAALGELGICQDGHPTDGDGAGLWPLAFHNWVVKNRGRRARGNRPKPFEAFEVGRQARFVSIGDVLSADELETVTLFRGFCARPRLALVAAGEPTGKLSDRQVAAELLVHLLEQSQRTLRPGLVRGRSVIDARLFDLYLQQAALARAEARRRARDRAAKGRAIGLTRESVEAMADEDDLYTFTDDSEPARILRESVHWPASEWLALSPDRRLFLYDHAKAYGGDPEVLDQLALDIIDVLAAEGDGAEVERWIAHRSEDPAAQGPIWSGDRGQRLLALSRESGFEERAVIALHRGVSLLERGDLPGSLRSFAYALQYAPESRASEQVHSLGLRWLSYVASQFEITDELLVTLRELVPRREYALLLEDLMWRAAFRSDRTSFERGVRNQASRGALERRLDLLEPLSGGDLTGFSRGLEARLEHSPSETLRFVDQLVQRLELEDSDVRRNHVPTLLRIRDLLAPLAEAAPGRQGRSAGELLDRTQAIVEGVGGMPRGGRARDRAHAMGPDAEVYAGAIRLAPADPLPWPLKPSEVAAPSVFEPLALRPVEWRAPDGALVFGWSIGG